VFLFGDISGKGVSASILMASLQAIFRSLHALGLPLGELLERGNRLFCESTMAHSFATLVCGRIAPSGTLEVVNAGHCPPLVVRGGRVETLPATGLPVGLFCTAEYASHTLALAPGDLLLLYTDGLSEARNRQGEEFGAERIASVLRGTGGASGPAVTRALIEELAAFQAGTARTDDLTVMALRRAAA
jgi:sigma-B regulation protein RsbU (phosphoserine phosphatase)